MTTETGDLPGSDGLGGAEWSGFAAFTPEADVREPAAPAAAVHDWYGGMARRGLRRPGRRVQGSRRGWPAGVGPPQARPSSWARSKTKPAVFCRRFCFGGLREASPLEPLPPIRRPGPRHFPWICSAPWTTSPARFRVTQGAQPRPTLQPPRPSERRLFGAWRSQRVWSPRPPRRRLRLQRPSPHLAASPLRSRRKSPSRRGNAATPAPHPPRCLPARSSSRARVGGRARSNRARPAHPWTVMTPPGLRTTTNSARLKPRPRTKGAGTLRGPPHLQTRDLACRSQAPTSARVLSGREQRRRRGRSLPVLERRSGWTRKRTWRGHHRPCRTQALLPSQTPWLPPSPAGGTARSRVSFWAPPPLGPRSRRGLVQGSCLEQGMRPWSATHGGMLSPWPSCLSN